MKCRSKSEHRWLFCLSHFYGYNTKLAVVAYYENQLLLSLNPIQEALQLFCDFITSLYKTNEELRACM